MRTIEARKKCRKEIISILKNAGLKEGIGLSDKEIDETKETLFWHGVVRNPKTRNKTNYIAYYFPTSQYSIVADNSDFLKEVIVAIDVFCNKSFDSKDNLDLLELLENSFIDNGYEVEFADEIFESETSLFHYPLTLYKLFS